MSALVFISHSHADQALAEALVEFVLGALDIEPDALRCTSVPGHQLPFGRTISEQLKADIDTSSAILVLLTRDSLRSNWVLFELGASWALGKIVVPILGRQLSVDALPGPLAAYPSVPIDAADASNRLADAVAQIARTLGLRERTGGKREAKLRAFVELARSWQGGELRPEAAQAMAFEIPWLILLILSKQTKYPAALFPQIKFYMSKLGITASNPIEASIRMDDEGAAAMDLLAELGGSLSVKHPELVPIYEGGANLMPLAARGKNAELEAAVRRMPLPAALKVPQPDLLRWLNEIHDYFNAGLKGLGPQEK